jgi:flagellar biosynthesis protein FlhA
MRRLSLNQHTQGPSWTTVRLIITLINLLGGLAIGVARHGMGFGDAASTFTLLTVGDGLVSQIPALLVSIAAGIVVTKGSAEGTAD